MKLTRVLSLSLGLVVLATVGVLINTATVGASPRLNTVVAAPPTPSIPVAITNTPLPVSINGTPNVNIGTPTVSINGTPNVTVANPATSPLPVYDVTESNDNAYFAGTCFGFTSQFCQPAFSPLQIPTVTNANQPAKLLVIDFVSGICSSVPGGEISAVGFNVNSQIGQNSATFVPVNTYSTATQIFYAFSQQTRIYAPAGSTLVMGANYNTAFGSGPPPLQCTLSLNGHFVLQ